MSTPFFVVSSGRSGTAAIARMLDSHEDVICHHEYLIQLLQPLGVKFQLGKVSELEALERLYPLRSAWAYSGAEFWGCVGNKLSWLIPPLDMLFRGQAKWVQLVRDGRKVVSSYYNKLADEIYDDEASREMEMWVYLGGLEPPYEKRYWWLPHKGAADQFERICWHWRSVHEEIEWQFGFIPQDHRMTVRLEDLVSNKAELEKMIHHIGINANTEELDRLQATLRVPHNVTEPVNYPLTDEQLHKFERICGGMIHRFGYEGEEYEVDYHPAM